MKLRSPVASALSILLLGSAGALGAVLLHDGEVGTDEARLDYVAMGDEVTLKGALSAYQPPDAREWDHVAATFANTTYVLEAPDDVLLLVTGMQPDLDGKVVKIEGAIVFEGPNPLAVGEVMVVHADSYTVPILFR